VGASNKHGCALVTDHLLVQRSYVKRASIIATPASQALGEIDFVVGNFNDTACPPGSLPISNIETCKNSVHRLSTNKCAEASAVDGYQSDCESSIDSPGWCARQAGCSQADTGCVIFNSRSGQHTFAPYARPICTKVNFAAGNLGDMSCPAGSVTITNVATCKLYAHQLSNKCTEASAVDGYQSECESATNRPAWCARQAGCTRADTGCVIYNGGANENAFTPYGRPICMNSSVVTPEVSCCGACLTKPYCSPRSGNCHNTKKKAYYESCGGAGTPKVACCGACLGKPYCSPKSGKCYDSKQKPHYESCIAT